VRTLRSQFVDFPCAAGHLDRLIILLGRGSRNIPITLIDPLRTTGWRRPVPLPRLRSRIECPHEVQPRELFAKPVAEMQQNWSASMWAPALGQRKVLP
jgi:hypothetical protein